jgi:predicted nucleic acid-binding Zn ribbon protein
VKPAETRQPPRQEAPEQRLHGRALAAHRGVAVTNRTAPVLHVCVICGKPLLADRLYTCSKLCAEERLDVSREQMDHLVDCALVHEQLDALVAGNPIGRARFTGTRSPKGRE